MTAGTGPSPLGDHLWMRRQEMLETIRGIVRDARIVDAMASVRRDLFVPEELRDAAYDDRALPIGYGQTISQPQIVASMTDVLRPQPQDMVLDVGTGCGYQAAVLSRLVRRVVSVERIPELAESARERLGRLGYSNVTVKLAGTVLGSPEDRPFDGILVAAAAPRVPDVLVEQLKPGGRLVVPVGSREAQYLTRVTRRLSNSVEIERLELCQFVPLIGEGAWDASETVS